MYSNLCTEQYPSPVGTTVPISLSRPSMGVPKNFRVTVTEDNCRKTRQSVRSTMCQLPHTDLDLLCSYAEQACTLCYSAECVSERVWKTCVLVYEFSVAENRCSAACTRGSRTVHQTNRDPMVVCFRSLSLPNVPATLYTTLIYRAGRASPLDEKLHIAITVRYHGQSVHAVGKINV